MFYLKNILMTDSLGGYVGWGKRYISSSEIQKMKKNMRKVPIIQKKSEQYHEHEESEAERILRKLDDK